MGAEGMDNGNINSNYRTGNGLLSTLSGNVTVPLTQAQKQ
jgi:hypothetical protein